MTFDRWRNESKTVIPLREYANCKTVWNAAKADSRTVLEEIRTYLADPWRGYSKAMAIIDRELGKK